MEPELNNIAMRYFFSLIYCIVVTPALGTTAPKLPLYVDGLIGGMDCSLRVLIAGETEKAAPANWIRDDRYLMHFQTALRNEPEITINEIWNRVLPLNPQLSVPPPSDLTYLAGEEQAIRNALAGKINLVTGYTAGRFAPTVLAIQLLFEAEYELIREAVRKQLAAPRPQQATNHLADPRLDPLRHQIYRLLRRFEYTGQFPFHEIFPTAAESKTSQDILHQLIGAWLLLNDTRFTEKHRDVHDEGGNIFLRPCYIIHPGTSSPLERYATTRRDAYKDRPYEVLINAWLSFRKHGSAYTSLREEFLGLNGLLDERWRKDGDRAIRNGFQYFNTLNRGEAVPLPGILQDRYDGRLRVRTLGEVLLRQSEIFHGLRYAEPESTNSEGRRRYALQLALAADFEFGKTKSMMDDVDQILGLMNQWLANYGARAAQHQPWGLTGGPPQMMFYSAKKKQTSVLIGPSWYAELQQSAPGRPIAFDVATGVGRSLRFALHLIGNDFAPHVAEVERLWAAGNIGPHRPVSQDWEDVFYGITRVVKRRLEVSRQILADLYSASGGLMRVTAAFIQTGTDDDYDAMLRFRREAQKWSLERTTRRELVAPRHDEKEQAVVWIAQSGEPIPRLPLYVGNPLAALLAGDGQIPRNTVLENVGMAAVTLDFARFGITTVVDVHQDEIDHDLEFEFPQLPGTRFPIEVKATLVEDGQVLDRTFYLSREEIALLDPRTTEKPALLAIVVVNPRGEGRVHYFRNPDLGGDLHPSEPGRNFGVYEFLRTNDPRRAIPEVPRIALSAGEN